MNKSPDYQYWCNRDLWTAWQSILLLLKVQPGKNLESSLDRYYPSSQTLWGEFHARMAMVTDAMDVGTLQPYAGGEFHKVHEFRRLRPKEFLKWAQGKGWEIPKELAGILDSHDPESEQLDTVEENLDPRERVTLLKIIAVLAKEACLDLTKPYPAADILIKYAAQQGLEVPTTNTIAGKLQEVQQLLESQ